MILSGLKLPISHTETDLKNLISKKTDINNFKYKIIKKSLDARKNDLNFVYSVEISELNKEFESDKRIDIPQINSEIRPIIVGFGPAGIFCSYILAKAGLKPIVFEMGERVEERTKTVQAFFDTSKLNERSNVQFGEGGAGAFSDGKLTTGINNAYCDEVLKILIEHGAPKEIEYLKYPHIGTDLLVEVIKNMRNEILSLGADINFNEKIDDIDIKNDHIISVSGKTKYYSDIVVFAIGHSSRTTFKMLYNKGLNMIPKAFSVGVRIEHLQDDINLNQYGAINKDNKILGPANYKLSTHLNNGRGVYTFCMCPGGFVVGAASEENGIVTNGMSYNSRSGVNANSAVLVSVSPDDFCNSSPLSGVDFQREIENHAYNITNSFNAPCQTFEDFLKCKVSKNFGKVEPTYKPGVVNADLNTIFPEYISDSLKEGINVFSSKISCFNDKDSLLTGPETRSSSPVRILRDDNFESNIKGIYPIGEGAGYAGGITSSAVDGIRCAFKIIENLKNN